MPDIPEIPRHEILSYDDIRGEVATFVADNHVKSGIPVDVEQIADVHLGLNIIPLPGLRARRQIDAFLSADRTSIYVDEPTATGLILNRHRFTLAHEIGHWYLHEDLYVAASRSTARDFADFINSIPEEEWAWYEYQAYAFAGLLLVPRPSLKEAYDRAVAFAAGRGFRVDPGIEAHRSYLAEHVAKTFQVSAEVILKRGAKDGLWPEPRPAGE